MHVRCGRDCRHVFIAVEGVDGAGKTTIARSVARRIGARYVRTPPPEYSLRTRMAVDSIDQLQARFLFYLSSVSYASKVIRDVLPTRCVICDRYVASTVANHRALGLPVKWPIEFLEFLRPDVTFFLTVSDETERQRRLTQRGSLTAADKLYQYEPRRHRLLTEFAHFPMVELDTAHLTIEEVTDSIIQHMAQVRRPSE